MVCGKMSGKRFHHAILREIRSKYSKERSREMAPVPYLGDHYCVDVLPFFSINRGCSGCGLVVEASGMR